MAHIGVGLPEDIKLLPSAITNQKSPHLQEATCPGPAGHVPAHCPMLTASLPCSSQPGDHLGTGAAGPQCQQGCSWMQERGAGEAPASMGQEVSVLSLSKDGGLCAKGRSM